MFAEVRSLLYVPGTRPAMLQNAPYFGADAVILDLEDAVAVAEKDAARKLVSGVLRHIPFGGVRTVVRVNAMGTPFFEADMRAVMPCGPDAVRLPKTETPEEVREADALMTALEKASGLPEGGVELHVILESTRGLLNAEAVAFASRRVTALNMGGQDLAAELGISKAPGEDPLAYMRGKVLLAAKAAGCLCQDSVFTDIEDQEGLYNEARRMADWGHSGKAAIHPSQVPVIHRAYRPEQNSVARALRIVRAAGSAEENGVGAYIVDGMMVDGPVVEQARTVLLRAKRAGMLEPADLEAV